MASRAEQLFEEIKLNTARFEEWLLEKKDQELQEDEFLDFKTSDIIDRPTSGKKYGQYRDSLCEAVSAFGNTEGGVVIYGIVCKEVKGSRDVIQDLKPLSNCVDAYDHFRKIKLNLTTPALSGIICLPIETGSNKEGYLAFFIPKGEHLPYRAEHDRAYYQRTIDSCVVMNHEVLRSMFYPRSKPKFEVHCTVDRTGDGDCNNIFRMNVFVKNIGKATAECVYAELTVLPCTPIYWDRNFIQANLAYSSNLIPKPKPSYSTLNFRLDGEIHPGHTTASLANTTFNDALTSYVYDDEGFVDRMKNVNLPSGITARITIYCRNNEAMSYEGHLSWNELKVQERAIFYLVYVE